MEETDKQKLDEIYRLARDNNRMLHAARRNAFMSGLLRIVFWIVMFVASWWAYVTYLNPLMMTLINQMAEIKGISTDAQKQLKSVQAGAQGQVTNISDVLSKLQAQLKSAPAGR